MEIPRQPLLQVLAFFFQDRAADYSDFVKPLQIRALPD